jgi:hypothetical protein
MQVLKNVGGDVSKAKLTACISVGGGEFYNFYFARG